MRRKVLVDWSGLALLLLLPSSLSLPNTDAKDVVPVKPIPETSLSTGVFYHIDLLSNGGRLTWSYTLLDDIYNHVQIVLGDTAKSDYSKASDRYFADALWMLVPSEHTGLYSLRNKAQPEAVITWAGESASGKFVVLYQGHANDTNYLEGGQQRNDVLWRVFRNGKDQNSYGLINNGFPDSGIMTYSDKDPSTDRRFVEIYDTGNATMYLNNPKYSWVFTKIN